MSFGGILRQATAVDVMIGPFVDSTDGDTEETGLTISQADVRLSKNAQADAQKSDNTACAHEGNGFYNCELDATDTDTVGQLTLWVHEAGALAVRHDFQVVEEAIYDALYASGATGLLPANVTQFGGSNGTFASGRPEVNATHWGGTAVGSANVLIDGALTAAKIAADAITAAKLHSDVTTELQSGLATAANLATVAGYIDTEIGDIQSRLPAALVNGRMDSTVDGTGLEAAALALINAEVDTALADYDPPTKAELDAAVADVSVDEIQATALADLFNTDSGTTYASAVAGSVVAEIADNAGGSSLTVQDIADGVWEEALADHEGTAGSVAEALATAGGSGASASDVAEAVWDALQANHVGAGSFGLIASEIADILVDTSTTLNDKIDTIDGIVDAILVDTGTTLQGELDGIQADTEDIQSRLPAALVNSRMDCTIDGTGMENGAVDAILNRVATGSVTDSTLGAIINDWENGGRLDTIVDSILTDTGTTLQNELDGIQADTEDIQSKLGTPSDLGGGATIAANLVNIEAQTDDIGAAGAGLTAVPWNANWDAEVQSEVADALGVYDPPTKTELDSGLAALNDLDAAGIRTAVGLASADLDTQLAAINTDTDTIETALDAVLALLDDARAEPGQGAPAVNPDAMTKLDYLYKAWRNKKDNDGSVTNLYADNGTTIDHKQTTSEDAGTVTKGEWGTGA